MKKSFNNIHVVSKRISFTSIIYIILRICCQQSPIATLKHEKAVSSFFGMVCHLKNFFPSLISRWEMEKKGKRQVKEKVRE